MKLKYYLRGLGLGIMFATLVLSVSFALRGNKEKLSDAEIISRAKELGMVQGETELIDATEQEDSQSPSETTDTQSTAETQNTSETSSETSSEASQAAEGENQNQGTYVLIVDETTTWRQVSEILAGDGVISDGADFWQYLLTNANGAILGAGEYTIPYGADYESIIGIITAEN